MNKSKWNFVIDAIMFILMGIIAGLGLLIKYVLLPGTERWVKFGRNVDMTFWGFDRHDWGTIHFILGITLVVLLILHIILHWKVIICLYKNIIKRKAVRIACALSFTIITLFLICFPFLFQIDVEETLSGRERYYSSIETTVPAESETKLFEEQPAIKEVFQDENSDRKTIQDKKYEQNRPEEHAQHEHHNTDPSIEVKGYMTLSEVTNEYNIPEDYLKRKLNLPSSVSGSNQLGHLRKQYGFKMSEIESIIDSYQKSKNREKNN
ncbi:DUF4405 domain-containing protein [Bacteroidota bacterium]